MAKIKILKVGETDIESTDIWRYCIHSDYPTQKIYASGQTTLTIAEGETSGSVSVNHSLGYAPMLMAMFETDNGKFSKVAGFTKFIKNVQATQYFAVDVSNDYIAGRVNDDHGGTQTDTYVSVNDIIRFTSGPQNGGVLPSPLQPNTNYYVKDIIDSERFTISTTLGGSKLNITDGGGYYGDIFENMTNPRMVDMSGTYSIESTSTSITFYSSPALDTIPVAEDVDISIYYIILYDQI